MSNNSHLTTMIHILTLLASAEEPISSAMIAGSVNTNPVTIRRALGKLREAGLVQTVAGAAGGALLARPAEQIKLAELYYLEREEHFFGLHPSQPNPNCPVGRSIQGVLTDIYDHTERLVVEELSQVTIADILTQIW
jgi:DNA-binding IscR family transcriptional regulator